MSATYLVRLRPHDQRRGHVLRRYTYQGIRFHDSRGWYRVEAKIAEYLRGVRQVATDEHAPLAFDVCTADEARAIDARENEDANPRKAAGDDIKLSVPRTEDADDPRDADRHDVPDERGASDSNRSKKRRR